MSDNITLDLREGTRNAEVTGTSHPLPGVVDEPPARGTSTMSTTTTERPTTIWVCPNCRTETQASRKRCTDCGTSRY